MNSVAFNSIQDIEEGMFFIQSSYSVGYARIHTEKNDYQEIPLSVKNTSKTKYFM